MTSSTRVFLSQQRREDLTELAAVVADEHCPNGSIDPERIADAKGITLSFGAYGEAFDGLLEHRAGRFHIYCNLTRVERPRSSRARFTLAHELGHFFIDEHRNALKAGHTPHPSRCEFESKNPVEQEADTFASCLLMPSDRFTKVAKKTAPGLGGILGLSKTFQTSVTSTALRYATLQIMPCIVVKWNVDFAWHWTSSDARNAGFGRTIASSSKLPADSATALARSGEPVPSTGYFQRGTTAAAWFPSVAPDGFRNVILIEQAVRLGRFGVLTFLYPDSEKR